MYYNFCEHCGSCDEDVSFYSMLHMSLCDACRDGLNEKENPVTPAKSQLPAVEHYIKNKEGRDFVVGDIRGNFPILRALLLQVKFNESKDRLFTTGNMINRGPYSKECIEFLDTRWFFPVRGNYEQLIIEFQAGKHKAEDLEKVGGKWFLDLTPEQRIMYARCFDTLPYAIDIESDLGLIGIVHADCAFKWSTFVDDLDDPKYPAFQNRQREKALVGYDRLDGAKAGWSTNFIYDLYALVCGFRPVKEVHTVGNAVFIDTGAGIPNGKLTILELGQLAKHVEVNPYARRTSNA